MQIKQQKNTYAFFGQGILVLFVIVTIFLVKDDFLQAVREKIPRSVELLGDNASDTQKLIENGSVSLEKEIVREQPGALRLSGSSSIDLTQSALAAAEILKKTNEERIFYGLTSLNLNNTLSLSAKNKLDDIFKRQYFEHISPTGKGVEAVAEDAGYEFAIVGENLALGDFTSSSAVVDAWMNSPKHRANILYTEYEDIGIAVRYGNFEGNNVWVAVQHFGKPISSCPSIDMDLKKKIEQDKKDSESMWTNLEQSRIDLENRPIKEGEEYENEIEAFNISVQVYNDLIAAIKKDIESFNSQATKFNTCASSKI
jgi:uncharacterized protein YkwD